MSEQERRAVICGIICAVAELPDRTSPEDWPEALLVTEGELIAILDRYLPAAIHSSPTPAKP